MRIAMIGPFGLAPKGTMRVRALPLARELAARGHAVRLFMPPWHMPEEAGRAWCEDGVELEYVPPGPGVPLLSYLAPCLRLVWRALAWHAQVVHCFKPKGYSGVAAWILWNLRRLGLTRSRLVVDEDDWEGPGGWNDLEPYPPLLRATFAWQERWGLCHNDGITVASRTLQTLAWSLGVPPDRVCYLPNGAHDPQTGDGAAVRTRFGLEAGPIILLYTRFFEYDVARAIDVFRAVLAEIPGARLLVVGRGLFQRQDARFDQLVAQAGLADSVVRAGWVPEAELPGFFRAADVAIYPFDDTLVNRAKCAVKLVDLLAAGVAVVADAVGQNGEYIVPNGSGLLVPPGDVGAMASATVRLLRDAARRQALGQAAMQRIHEHFGWPRLASDLEAFYTQRLSRA